MNDKILDIISKHTLGVPRAKTIEDLADLENNTVKELEALFSLHGVVSSKITVLITYNENDVVFGCFRTTKKTKIIEVDDLKDLNKLGDDLVDVKILK